MTASEIPNLDDLRRTWAASPEITRPPETVAREVRERLRRAVRRSVILTGGEALMTVAVFLGLLRVIPPLSADAAVWYVLAVGHSAIVWALAVWSRLALWAPLAGSTHAVLERLEQRAVRQEVESRWMQRLLAVEGLAFVAWLIALSVRGEPRVVGSGLRGALALGIPAIIFAVTWERLAAYRRRGERERAWVAARLREFGAEDHGSTSIDDPEATDSGQSVG